MKEIRTRVRDSKPKPKPKTNEEKLMTKISLEKEQIITILDMTNFTIYDLIQRYPKEG